MRPGTRVIALRNTEPANKKVFTFGAGVYEGDFEHPRLGISNPRIKLDNGETVWGCECWWDDADLIKSKFPTPEWTWVDVDIVAYRKSFEEATSN